MEEKVCWDWQRGVLLLLLLLLAGQFVLSGGTGVRLWPCDRDPHPPTVAFQPALIGRVVDVACVSALLCDQTMELQEEKVNAAADWLTDQATSWLLGSDWSHVTGGHALVAQSYNLLSSALALDDAVAPPAGSGAIYWHIGA
ncbi:hypothetical protein EYF80_058730 [Liparis tanakae]|uniref:Uncharacterized protein n=1 Tax=Liparis tanakae TaxID=230148 RepID=A0A4Z2EQK1_9TELE|nr:hypothetical protein EYF80_058730 [Liparis tanakae]